MNNIQEKWFDRLREMAEQAVENRPVDINKIDAADITKLINDIQVFQMELEIQNDELRTSLDELEKSRTRFSRLFDMAPAGYIVLDKSGMILDVNQTMLDMLDTQRDDLMHKPFSRFIAPDDQGIFLARFTAFYKNPADKTMEIRLTRGSSAVFHARLEGRFIPLETYQKKPDIDQFCLIVTDISESKKAEKELKTYAGMLNERNKELQCLYSISGVINDPANTMADIFNKTAGILAGAVQYPDNACGRITYKNREYATRNFAETEWRLAADIVINGETPGCVEIYYVEKMPVIHDSPFIEEEKALINSVAMRLGQTIGRREAEKKLHEQKKRLEGIIEGTNVGTWEWNVQTGETVFNDKWAQIIGYTLEELAPVTIKTWEAHAHPEDFKKSRELLKQHFAGELPYYDCECRMKHKDGHWVEVHDRGKVITWTSDGQPLMMFGTHQDITQQKEAEARIFHLQKTESLGRMAGAVAHHYNNLLTIVMGNLDMALVDLPGDCDAAASLSHAMEAGRRASKLGSMMLAYLGQTNAPRKPLDLSLTCREFLPALQSDMPSHIILAGDLQETGPAVTANARQIQQILECLVTNAWEAMGNQPGTVFLGIRRVFSSEIGTGHRYPVDFQPGRTDYACMEVTDSGEGIPEKDVEKIFEPFYSTRFTGRGLGLPVALAAVKTHRGCMTVATRQGSGTTITVFLPVTENTDQVLTDKMKTDE